VSARAGHVARRGARPATRLELIAAEMAGEADAPTGILYERADASWHLWVQCGRCGGHRLPLDLHEPAARARAEARAEAYLDAAEGACLGCEAREWRSRVTPPADGEARVWWDVREDGGEWMAWQPLPGSRGGVSIPLGLRSYWARRAAQVARRALEQVDALPLRIALDPVAVESSVPTAFCAGRPAAWALWVPCFHCGGFELGLGVRGRGQVEAAGERARRCLARLASDGACPRCVADRHRHRRPPAGQVALWFDPEAGVWLLWQRLPGTTEGVVLPLEISDYGVSEGDLHRAAADLVFAADRLLEEGAGPHDG
jgi:hypothetical protein